MPPTAAPLHCKDLSAALSGSSVLGKEPYVTGLLSCFLSTLNILLN